MIPYGVDPARSSIVAAVRPPMGPPTLPATVTGAVAVAPAPARERTTRRVEPGELEGHLDVSLDGQPPVRIDLALAAADATAELSHGADGELVLRGQRTAPAGAFGIVGPPLLNPSIVLSWRLVLDPG